MQVGKQLHISRAEEPLSEEHFTNACNSEETAFMKKPARQTGLWTSSFREETQDSAWVEWCRWEHFGEPYKDHWYLLTPREDVKLFVIDEEEDLYHLMKAYQYETMYSKHMREAMADFHSEIRIADRFLFPSYERGKDLRYASLDFERLREEGYDGIWLTEKGNGECHLSFPLDLNGWDAECVLWLRWCFTSVERIETPEPVMVGSEE